MRFNYIFSFFRYCSDLANTQHVERPELDLNSWFATQPNRQDAERAKQRILECLETGSEVLNLQDLNITSLPEGFNPPQLIKLDLTRTPITHLPEGFNPLKLEHFNLWQTHITSLPEGFNPPQLKELNLTGTRLTHLPEDFNPPFLEELILENTRLTHLPEGFNSPQLKKLDLARTQITSLPEGFNPLQLQTLKLSGTRLTHLPEGFNSPQLQRLYLLATQITSLPEGFNPPQLQTLDLTRTPITHLPEGFNPPQLQVLYLARTQITSLPEGFNPPCLELLDLSNTEMTSLPETLFNLPCSCTITLDLSRFSTSVRENLQERVTGENYQGPRFQFSMGSSAQAERGNLSLEQVFDKVFEKSGLGHGKEGLLEKLTENKTELETQNLKRWLNRLFETASGRVDRNESFFKEVVNILQLAGSNENFRDNVFYRVLDGANVTCGDRIALSILHLGVQKDLETLDTHHPEEVADFLVNGVMTLDLLEDYARDLVPTLPFTDPLEVYLGLPIYFKEEFNIPINTENMLYFTCSGLRQEHLDAAREKLQTALHNEDKVLSFLIDQPKWLEVLKKARPEKMRELEESKERRLEEEPIEKAEEILEEYNQGLKDLSKVVRRIARFSLRIRD